LSANRIRAGDDGELEAKLRNPPLCDVPVGLEESLLAAIPARFGAGTSRPVRRRRTAIVFAAVACIPAAIAVSALFRFDFPRSRPRWHGASGLETAPAALNTHAEETRPCDVLPPLP
jgi:hypothetical protein